MKFDFHNISCLVLLCFCFSFSVHAEDRVSQIINGNDYEALKAAFDGEISRSKDHVSRAKKLEAMYPNDDRPRKNREEWEEHILLCEDRFFSVLKEIFNPTNIETEIQAPTVAEIRDEYRKRTGDIDKRVKILNELKERYPKHDTGALVDELKFLRKKFRNARYACPEHHSVCRNCISSEEDCRACGGDGKWGACGWRCQLCNGTGRVWAPGKTYCPNCHGRWDEGKNCTKCCRRGLVSCPSCSSCKTISGIIFGESLEF